MLGSGEGPGIDKGGGIHDLSHQGDHEPGHVETDRPGHTGVLRPSTAIPSGCYSLFFEPHDEKTGLHGFRTSPTRTGMCSHLRGLEV